MATTSIWRVHGYIGKVLFYAKNPDKTTVQESIPVPKNANVNSLEDVISYACREDVTQEKRLVSGINCKPETVREEMMKTKLLEKKSMRNTKKHQRRLKQIIHMISWKCPAHVQYGQRYFLYMRLK